VLIKQEKSKELKHSQNQASNVSKILIITCPTTTEILRPMPHNTNRIPKILIITCPTTTEILRPMPHNTNRIPANKAGPKQLHK